MRATASLSSAGFSEREIHGQRCLLGNFQISIPELSWEEQGKIKAVPHGESDEYRFGVDPWVVNDLGPNTDIHGYFFSWRYFCGVWPELMQDLKWVLEPATSIATRPIPRLTPRVVAHRLRPHIQDPAVQMLADIKKKFIDAGTATADSPLVGVHVRRGDILSQKVSSALVLRRPASVRVHARHRTSGALRMRAGF